jgi:hypothetical protein
MTRMLIAVVGRCTLPWACGNGSGGPSNCSGTGSALTPSEWIKLARWKSRA